MAADISLRKSIRWLPHPASEPTSTIVLTSPERRFVDIRVFLPLPSSSPDIPLEKLDWAIGGHSTSSPVTNPATKEVEYSHCVWHHWIDSRVNSADVAADEGDNYSVEGRPELTLEKGRMVNPGSGEVGEYEEVWEAGGLRRWGEWRGLRGMVVRLGGYVQGFLRDGEGIRVERWVWDGERGVWERKIRIGSGKLEGGNGVIPVEFVTEVGGQMEIGDEVVAEGGRRWRVVEKSLA
ncbi:hypothetical protein B0T21DRAFT_336919 [Apiosordaria backusii]|uniref:Protein HRI1 n=1 Tax=Apiosordaria backusii TaxID=314023 RepID=A0AA40B2M4_9PEZI|nr:hypothetical protein B0T21DRAFT_336919 [Apiosordaria backusii]